MSHLLRRALRALSELGSPSPHIFISYRRRGEGAGYAGRLADRLVHEFGADQCFRDIDDIETGTDFVDEISRAVGSCQVLIVVIGPDWLDARDGDGLRRLDDPRDFVRIEVAAALARGIRVVPVLVGGATMPSPEKLPSTIEGLARRQAHELSDSRWEYDMGQLMGAVETMGVRRRATKRPANGRRLRRMAAAAAVTVVAAAALPLSRALLGAGLLDRDASYSDAGYSNPGNKATEPSTTRVTRVETTGDTALLGSMQELLDQMFGDGSSVRQIRASRDVATGRYPADDAVARAAIEKIGDKGTPAWRDDIVAALRRANDAQTRAHSSLDAAVLAEGFTGEALQLETFALATIRLAGERISNRLHEQQILDINVSDDGSLATAEAVETWSSTHYDVKTEACLYRMAPRRIPQTVQLVHQDGRWLVAAIDARSEPAERLDCN